MIKAYSEFQQCWCITLKDMNIFLSAIFIFLGLILLLVAETSEQHRYLVIIIIYSDYRVHGTQNDQLEPNVLMQKLVMKNIHRVLTYWQKCVWVAQRFLLQATKSDHEK